MRKFIRSKRGFDAFTLVLTILAISVLMIILVGLTVKYNKLANTIGGAGSGASVILSAYDKADSALLYLDNAVDVSMQDAIYDMARNGFYPSGLQGSCGTRNGYVLWSRGFATPVEGKGSCKAEVDNCVPSSYNKDNSFDSYFDGNLKRQLSAYNSDNEVKLPEDGYLLQLGRPGDVKGGLCEAAGKGCFVGTGKGPLQLVGTAPQPVVVDSARVHYEVNPSFRVNSDVDVVGDFEKLAGRAWKVVGKEQAGMEKTLASYSRETGLNWNVDNYNKACGQACNTGEKCTYCCEEETVEVSCATEENPDCKKKENVCVRTCEGNLNQYYCNIDAGISVRIPDADYGTGGNSGYKGFAASGSDGKPEVREYAYRFGLNWVEMQDAKQCI